MARIEAALASHVGTQPSCAGGLASDPGKDAHAQRPRYRQNGGVQQVVAAGLAAVAMQPGNADIGFGLDRLLVLRAGHFEEGAAAHMRRQPSTIRDRY